MHDYLSKPNDPETLPSLFKKKDGCPKTYICPKCMKKGHYQVECQNEMVYRKRSSQTKKLSSRVREEKEDLKKIKKDQRRKKLEKIREEEVKKDKIESNKTIENLDSLKEIENNPDVIFTGNVDPSILEQDSDSSQNNEPGPIQDAK
ncbi:MAG: hypothetical protein MHMPM18_002097 [Marteilia pararefringens]